MLWHKNLNGGMKEIHNKSNFHLHYCFVFAAISALFLFLPDIAVAEVCTSQSNSINAQSVSGGIIPAIMNTITAILRRTSEGLFNNIVGHAYYTAALAASALLTVIVYGVMLVFDLANLKPGEIVNRLFKLGLVMWIASPTGWELINGMVAKFFLGGMAELVNLFLIGAVQNSPWGGGTTSVTFDPATLGQPLMVLSGPMAQLFGSKFGITIIGLFNMFCWQGSGQALFMLLVMLWAGWNLMLALFNAIFVYVKSIVGLWFLMALSPIFIIFILYQTTRDLFQGWLNMVISFALQPVLLFAFFAFFLVMVSSSLANIMAVEWCVENIASGLPFIDVNVWLPRSGLSPDGTRWSVDPGTVWTVTGAQGHPGVQFPIQMIDTLFFLLSAYLGLQYANFVPQLTTQLSKSGLALGAGLEDTRQFLNARGFSPEALGAKALATGGGWAASGARGAMRIGSNLMGNRGGGGGPPPQA